MTPEDLRGRSAALATMHGKERAFGPVLAERRGLALVVPPGIDTDALGTFTGEVPRAGSIEETAIAKAALGARASGLALALASEGAYGPHPSVPFLGAGLEVAVLLATRTGHVIREHLLDERPVYDRLEIAGGADLDGFLARIGFPEQAVIARRGEETLGMVKGIRDRDRLKDALSDLSRGASGGPVIVQTDMRAHLNPRRMATLRRLAERLADRLATGCPDCGTAGFGITRTRKGLPCEWCGAPTGLVAGEVWACAACGHAEERARRDGLAHADPGQCERCNP